VQRNKIVGEHRAVTATASEAVPALRVPPYGTNSAFGGSSTLAPGATRAIEITRGVPEVQNVVNEPSIKNATAFK
jgi:hypothetical protein